MGFVLCVMIGMFACLLSVIAWLSICLVGGWPMPMEDTVRGVAGLFFVVSAGTGAVLQLMFGFD